MATMIYRVKKDELFRGMKIGKIISATEKTTSNAFKIFPKNSCWTFESITLLYTFQT